MFMNLIRFISFFVFSSRRRYTRLTCDWSSDVCSSDLVLDASDCRLCAGAVRKKHFDGALEAVGVLAGTAAAPRGRSARARQGGPVTALAEPDPARSEERRVGKEDSAWCAS